MTESPCLIPAPEVIRERLARVARERRILRSLLKLSIDASRGLGTEESRKSRRPKGGAA